MPEGHNEHSHAAGHAADHSTNHAASHTRNGAAHAAAAAHAPATHAAAHPVNHAATHTAPAADKAPIFRAIYSLHQTGNNIGQAIIETGQKTRAGLDKILRKEDPGDTSPDSLLKTPFTIAGNLIDAAAFTPLRRITEISSEVLRTTRSIYRTATRPIFHPVETLKHPLKYLANPLRTITSAARTVKEVINAPARTADELVNRGIKRPIQKLPIIGQPIALIAKGAGWLTAKVRGLFEWLTGWIDNIDDKLAASQG